MRDGNQLRFIDENPMLEQSGFPPLSTLPHGCVDNLMTLSALDPRTLKKSGHNSVIDAAEANHRCFLPVGWIHPDRVLGNDQR